jgi:AcrR family transcriptional regulator
MPPRVEPEEQRATILAAAAACFSRKGYHRTTMDEIVAESGLSKGTLYWYFESKQDLFLEMFESWGDTMLKAMKDMAESRAQPAADRVRALGMWSMEMFAAEPEIVTLLIEAYTALRGDREAYERLLKIYSPFLDMLTDVIEDGVRQGEFKPVNARPLAEALGAALDGIALQHLIGMPGDTRERLATFVEVVIEGLTRTDADA